MISRWCKISTASSGDFEISFILKLFIDSLIVFKLSPVIARVAGASPNAMKSLSDSIVTLIKVTSATSLNAVIKAFSNGIFLTCVLISIIFRNNPFFQTTTQ